MIDPCGVLQHTEFSFFVRHEYFPHPNSEISQKCPERRKGKNSTPRNEESDFEKGRDSKPVAEPGSWPAVLLVKHPTY
jgi:hypothetical protein